MTARLLKCTEVATITGLSPSTIRRLIADGRLASVRPTRRTVRVPEAAVDALVAGTKSGA